MKKMIMVLVATIFLGIMAGAALSQGTIISQSQLDGFTEQQIIDFVMPIKEGYIISVQNMELVFLFSIPKLQKYPMSRQRQAEVSGDYILTNQKISIGFGVLDLIQCVLDNNKTFCVQEVVKLKIENTVNEAKWGIIDETLAFQTKAPESPLTEQEINDLIDGIDLNKGR